jgi:alpha-D-ribose 1-methylphosphonate 5-triphosphate synthase subunit PhnH
VSAQAVIFTPQARRAQADFREALECLARPGRVGRLSDAQFPATAARCAYSLLLALADQEVSLAVIGGDKSVARFASLGTGSRLVDAGRAHYVLCLHDPGRELAGLRRGSLEAPEDGATAILCVDAVGEGDRLTLSGPGVDGRTHLAVRGLSAEALHARSEACAEYPLGIDLFLVDSEGRTAGIPRTTCVTPAESN